jgi:hypothetical protein
MPHGTNVEQEVTMTLPIRIATVVSLSTLFLAPAVMAQTSQSNPSPTQADFDACNKHAAANAGSPSAAIKPRTGPMITGPGTPETQSGAAASTPSGQDMRITGSEVPGAREAGLTGMAPASLSDVAYQEAYRDCMQSRGF